MTDVPQTARSALQRRVAAAILDAAAHVFAAGGESSMNEIAESAGVGRATLYRYFPSRQALWAEVAEVAVTKIDDRLRAARLDGVEVEDGLRRAVRALVDVGDYFIVLAQERLAPSSGRLDPAISGPLDLLFERGQSSGVIRPDIPSSRLTDVLVAQVVSELSTQPVLGNEDAIVTIASLFLDGARARTSESTALGTDS